MGFEPTVPFRGTHALQACSLDHSDTSPRKEKSALQAFFMSQNLYKLTRDAYFFSSLFSFGDLITKRHSKPHKKVLKKMGNREGLS